MRVRPSVARRSVLRLLGSGTVGGDRRRLRRVVAGANDPDAEHRPS